MKLTVIKVPVKPVKQSNKIVIELSETEAADLCGILENALWSDFSVAKDFCVKIDSIDITATGAHYSEDDGLIVRDK